MSDANPDDFSDRSDYPDSTSYGELRPPPEEPTRYASYDYRNYADVVWFPPLDEDRPPTKEDEEAAMAHAGENNRLYGTDLLFGGIDQWRRLYGGDHEKLSRERAEGEPHTIENEES